MEYTGNPHACMAHSLTGYVKSDNLSIISIMHAATRASENLYNRDPSK
jgi:hypothetical protein